MFHRIATLVRKEMQALLRDRQGRVLLVAPVILQLIVFSNAATLEVKNNTLAILCEGECLCQPATYLSTDLLHTKF